MTTTSKAMVAQGAIETEAQGGLFDRAFRRYMVAREARARSPINIWRR